MKDKLKVYFILEKDYPIMDDFLRLHHQMMECYLDSDKIEKYVLLTKEQEFHLIRNINEMFFHPALAPIHELAGFKIKVVKGGFE
jgi:hypothetical protein